MAALILALRFLTILPVPGREAGEPEALGRAAWWFPVVGLALGAVLAGLDRVLAWLFPPLVAAAVLVAVWKALTGGIHLDGLADCLDGWAGRDREHRLAIMRDSRVGVFGAIGLTLVLLLALVALAETPGETRWRVLLLAPALGRTAPLLAALGFAPATPGRGLGAPYLAGLSRGAVAVHGAAAGLLAAALLGGAGAAAACGALLVALGWLALLARRLGGLTGDALGSAVEVAEVALLLGGASLAPLGARSG